MHNVWLFCAFRMGYKKRSNSKLFIGFGWCVFHAKDISNKIYQKISHEKNTATVCLFLIRLLALAILCVFI